MWEKMKDRLQDMSPGKLLFNVIFMIVGALLMGYILRVLLANIGTILSGEPFAWHPEYLFSIGTFVIGLIFMVLAWAVFWVGTSRSGSVSDATRGFLGG